MGADLFLGFPTANPPETPASIARAVKISDGVVPAFMVTAMNRALIQALYEETAFWLWPVLWFEIIRMQCVLAALPDAEDPRILYEIRVTSWGSLQLIQLTHEAGLNPDAWRAAPKVTGAVLCAEYLPEWITPRLQRAPQSLLLAYSASHCSASETRGHGPEALYLDPG